MLSPELRSVLMDGPPNGYRDILRYGGAATVRVAWGKHREELMAACPPGRRPWGFWMIERRLKARTSGEHGELKLILELGLARSEDEARFVELRLAELLRARPKPFRAVA